MSRILRILPLMLLLLLVLTLGAGLIVKHARLGISSQMIGQKLPAIDLPALGGGTFSSAAWQGKVALINVFASWCEPCAMEHPLLVKLAAAHTVTIYGIAWKDQPERINNYLATRGNPYARLGFDREGKTTVKLAISGVPESFIVDRSGVVRFHFKGALTEEMADSVIPPLVDKLNRE